MLIREFLEFKNSNDSNAELIQNVVRENNNNQSKIDWEQLEAINKDIIAWIKIPNTKINYPVLKDDNTLKYLNHSFDKKYSKSGSIFTVDNNPFNEDVTNLYGHNVKNGLMFSQLGKYMNKDFFIQHSIFEIYTKSQNYKATIFSCYSTGIETEANKIKGLDFEAEIEYYKVKSEHVITNIGEIRKIVKLSTCSYINNHTRPTNQRYYIVAKLEAIN
ncbi:MAG: class B sortase [Clostridia bacterium]|nr:class B sortase [Clostridia bacterium]